MISVLNAFAKVPKQNLKGLSPLKFASHRGELELRFILVYLKAQKYPQSRRKVILNVVKMVV